MELTDLVRLYRRWWWLVLIGSVAAMLAAYGAFRYFTQWPPYVATTTILVGDENLDFNAVQGLRDTYAELARRRPITTNVVETLGLPLTPEGLADLITTTPVGYTRLLEIAATYGNPQTAAAIANQIADELSRITISSEQVSVQMIAPAQLPESPSVASYLGIAIAMLLGFAVTSGLLFVVESFRNKVRKAQDVTQRLGIPLLGMIRRPRQARWRRTHALAPVVQQTYGWLAFHVEHATESPLRKLLITSPKSIATLPMITEQLATVWARTKAPIALVDLARQEQQTLTWYRQTSSSRLKNGVPPATTDAQPLVDWVATGTATTAATAVNPLREVTSPTVESQAVVLDRVLEEATLVIARGAPVLENAETISWMRAVDGILLVLQADQSDMADAQQAIDLLQTAGAPILGTLLIT